MLARLSVVGLWIGAVAIGGSFGFSEGENKPSTISFLSVGQGDSTVIRHQGLTIVVDAGPATDTFDAGSRLVAPKLKSLGARRIDLLILTHPDADHIGGLPGLAARLRIDNLAIPHYFRGHPEMKSVLETARIQESEVLWIDRPIRIVAGQLGMDIRLPNYLPGEGDNEGSPFVRLDIAGSSAVLTGDAGESTELAMLGKADWRADMLKAGHHGSGGSSAKAWLEKVDPDAVIVSCGIANRFDHPAAATVDRVKAIGATLLRTDREGDLHFVAKDAKWVRQLRR